MSDWEFAEPPVWEAGVAVSTSSPTLYDQYNVSRVHDLFSERFPRAERQLPLPPIEQFVPPSQLTTLGPLSIQIQPAAFPDQAQARWWFISEDGHNLLQLQESFLGRYWRRTDQSSAPSQGYPKFDGLLADFESSLQKIEVFNLARNQSMPQPAFCDVNYVNFVPLIVKNKRRNMRDTLPFLGFSDGIAKMGTTASWLEPIGDLNSGGRLLVQVDMVGMAPPEGGAPINVARLALNARTPCSDWRLFREKAVTAHDYMRARLIALTSAEAQATWRGHG